MQAKIVKAAHFSLLPFSNWR